MGTLLLRAGRLIDGTGSPPLDRPEVVLEGDRIRGVGRQGDRPVAPDAMVIDLGDRTLLPGLVDAHVHFFGVDPRVPGDRFSLSKAFRAIRSVVDAHALLEAGFTAVRCLGSGVSIDLAFAIEIGLIPGPRLVSAGEFICKTGGTWDQPSLPREWVDFSGMFADGEDACREIVRQRLRQGAGVIKIGCSVGGSHDFMHAWGDDLDHSHLAYSPSEIQALVDEAHRGGVKVSAHAIGTEPVRAAVLAGVDTIEHGHGIDDETLKLMGDRGTTLVPTLSLQHLRGTRGLARGMSERELRAVNAHRDVQRKSFEKALAAGVKMAVGTDLVGPPYADHGLNALEFQLMHEWGASAMDVLIAGTRIGAEALGLDREIGTVEVGKLADLVATDEDPLQDITALQRVAFVMKSGRVVKGPAPVAATKPPQAGVG